MSSHRESVSFRTLYMSAAFSVSSIAFLSTGALAGTSSGTLSFATATYGVVQNLGTKTIYVNRTGGSSGAATVLCKTANDTAVAGQQYTAVSTTLKWANGDTAPKTCTVPISTVSYQGTKTFYVKLSGAGGAVLGSPSTTTVQIRGNLGGGNVSLSAPTFSVSQNAGGVTIAVNRTNGAAGAAAVFYATANVSAIAGTDYTAEHGMLSWANGDAAPKTFTIPVSNAKPISGSKTFAVALATAEDVVLGSPTSAIVTIHGNAAPPPAPTTGEATLSWVRPTLYTNGSPMTDLAGYKIYYGKSSTALTGVIQVTSPSTVEFEISSLGAGTWYFSVSAYNSEAVESERSAVASKTI
jgi:Calx-beta domain